MKVLLEGVFRLLLLKWRDLSNGSMPIIYKIYNIENILCYVFFLRLGFDFDPTLKLNYFLIFMDVRVYEIPGSKSRPFFSPHSTSMNTNMGIFTSMPYTLISMGQRSEAQCHTNAIYREICSGRDTLSPSSQCICSPFHRYFHITLTLGRLLAADRQLVRSGLPSTPSINRMSEKKKEVSKGPPPEGFHVSDEITGNCIFQRF